MAESKVSLIGFTGHPSLMADFGTVHDTVTETESWNCTHIFVADPQQI